MNTIKGFSTIWGSVILLIVAVIAFYFISKNIFIEDIQVITNTPLNEKSELNQDMKDVSLQTEKVFQYSSLYATKYGTDVFIVNLFSSHYDVSSVGTYHIDTMNNIITQIDTPYIYQEENKLYGLKYYEIDYEYIDSEYVLDKSQLQKISDEIGVDVDNLKVEAFGDKPSYKVLVKTQYDPITKKITLLKTDKSFEFISCDIGSPGPCFDGKFFYKEGGFTFPGSTYVEVGTLNELSTDVKEVFGIKFSYDLKTEKIGIEY